MSESKLNNEQEGKELLSSIFYSLKTGEEEFSPIIKNSYNISNLLLYLKNKNNSIEEKAKIISTLFQLYKKNDLLIPLFMKKNITNIINLYEPLIDLYLSKEENINEYKEIIEQIIKMIRNEITLNKGPIAYIFQKLSNYFENKETEEKERLNENEILKYLNLLKLFYSGNLDENTNFNKRKISNDKNDNNTKIKSIKNYIYFNGIRSSISLALNQNSINNYTDYPTLQYGLSFIMWIYIDKNLFKQYQEINNNCEIKLVVINISGEQLKLVLKDLNTFQISLNDNEIKEIPTKDIKANNWNNICFSISEKNSKNLSTKICINSLSHSSHLAIPKDFPISNKINTIKLFENFIGKVSSFMIINKEIEQKEVIYFSNMIKYGFYKNKILFEFIMSNEKHYFSNCKNYIYYENSKSNKLITSYDFNSSKQSKKNLIGIFCPFAYNNENNQIDDINGNFIGILGENDGVNYFINNSNNIRTLGGINNLLPIIELMHSTISGSKKIKYDMVDKSILTESTFYEYMNLIKKIIEGHRQNYINANESNFFSSLSLFIEKFPSHLFTPKILNIIIDLGKEAFQNEKIISSNGENYINLILLNEKLIYKYDQENQLILWFNIYSFFSSDETQIKKSFNMGKICLLLRFLDEKRYSEYCCQRHAEIFKDNNDQKNNLKIMEPGLNIRLNEIFKIIQIYIEKFCEEEQTNNLFQLLSLDLSPCLQKKIIQVYLNYFRNEKIDLNKKINFFEILIRNNFMEIIEYVFSISLLDIRVDILSLFKILFDNKELRQIFQDYMGNEQNGMTNFYIFISDNLLPEQIYMENDTIINKNKNENLDNNLINNKNKDIELIQLSSYFNREIYGKGINEIWLVLLNWMLYQAQAPPNLDVKKKDYRFNNIHNFVIEFCISFSSKSPFNYIDLFLLSLISFFKDESILNREILYKNKKLYPWIVETIFYFHNSEINSHPYKKEDILSIKKNSIDLFQEFFIHRRPYDETNKRIYHIIIYSVHLKKISGDTNKKKILEISRITRLLLQKIIEVSPFHMNYKTKACFYFIIFHKYFTQLTGFRNNITNNNENGIKRNFLNKSVTISDSRKFNTINNNSINDDNILPNENYNFEVIDKDLIEKTNNESNNKKDYNSISPSLELDNPVPKEYRTKNLSLNKIDIIPPYIFEGLHFKDNIDKNSELKENKGNNLKSIWEDFPLYDSIIDYYSSNIWGIENLRKRVKLDIDTNNEILYNNLLKQYGTNKSYRNILIKDVLKCFNIKYSEEDTKAEKVEINILNINVILLSIAIEITQDFDEKSFLERKFYQFIIFCILSSINIASNCIYYNLIQDNIYDCLGFAFLFLKKIDKNKYEKYLDNLIMPILDKKSKILKSKKNNNKNSAIYRLFELRERKIEEKDDFLNNSGFNRGYATSRNTVIINYKKSDNDILSNKNIYKDDSNINETIKVVFKGDIDLIIKHLFGEILERIKEERKCHFGFKANYKNVYNNNLYFEGNCPTEEKLRINKVIKKIIPLYEIQIKKYANEEYLSMKNKRNNYKVNKAKLFSWNGFWSNRYLFYEHPELLKLKIKNHFTKEMAKPLLVPILDIDYYTPPFKQFDKTTLFNNNNFSYKINLDIDDILLEKEDEENSVVIKPTSIEDNVINEPKKECVKNKYGFNFLECFYKLFYKDIWDKYLELSKYNTDFEKLIKLNKEAYSTLINSKIMSKDIENIQRENIYNCCIVKLTHHIKGYISTEKSMIRFIHDSNIKEEEIENDINYDKEMHCCFGSIFKNKNNDKDKVILSIEYTNIKYFFIRQYFYIESGLEIYTKSNKSYFFNFRTNKDLIQFKNDILHHGIYGEIKAEDFKGKKIVGYQQINPNSKKKIYLVNNKMEEWQNNNISTLEYLMWLNIFSGRSFNDLTQYPVFPWIITNYSDNSEEISIKDDLRNLNIPMGMISISEKGELRRDNFIETYESLKNDLKEMYPYFNYQDYLKKGDEYLESYKNKKYKKEKDNKKEIEIVEFNQIPYFYGSHYSNPTYISHFLTRTFPYTYISIEIQGQTFDDPDRMFSSMLKTFESASTLKDDVRELIPEFYILPEIFLNKNNLNLSQNRTDTDNNLIIINDVKMPKWSNNNVTTFVIKLRRYLESNYITSNLNKWIDLIFGSIQKGEKAEENHNIFKSHTYEKIVKIESIDDIDVRNALMRQYEMGVTPYQIFESESKNKIRNSQNITFDESQNLTYKIINSKIFDELKSKNYKSNDNEEKIKKSSLKIIKMDFEENGKLKIFTNQNQIYSIKIEEDEISNNNKYILKLEESQAYKYNNNSTRFTCSYLLSDIEIPFISYNNNHIIIKGGFWDHRLEVNIIDLENKEEQSMVIFNPDDSPITTMKISKNEKILLCGTKDGTLLYYKLSEKKIEYQNSLYLFDDEILSISINEILNMFAISSKNGVINLYTLPSFKLVRIICLNKKNENEKKNKLYANNIFLSSSPLPCITLYIKSKKLFKSFTINGEFICEINETDNSYKIKNPIIYTNNNFQDILLYGTNDGFIKFRKFPEMTLINSIKIFPGEEINTICLTPNKKYLYVWSSENVIAIVKTI